MKPQPTRLIRKRSVLSLAFAGSLLAFVPRAHAAEPAADAIMCDVLRQLIPRAADYAPEIARAQLVAAIVEKYDYDAEKLKLMPEQIDELTSASCPEERKAMLDIVKTETLAEAVS